MTPQFTLEVLFTGVRGFCESFKMCLVDDSLRESPGGSGSSRVGTVGRPVPDPVSMDGFLGRKVSNVSRVS